MRELAGGIRHLLTRVELLEIMLAPKQEDRMFEKPFQQKTVTAGLEEEVYRQVVPRGYAGIVTRIGNDWFPNTVLTRYIDSKTMEPKIERSIAPVTDPMAVKIFALDEIVWRAKNNDTILHTFGILTDGFFVPRDVFERIVAIEG